MRMTPIKIQVLMHYHYCLDPLPVIPAFNEAIKTLETCGLIESCGKNQLCTTIKGKKYVEMICNTPYPVMAWIDPRDMKDD